MHRKTSKGLLSVLIGRTLVSAAADGLELRQLQVIHRHGDRTPITPLADRKFWQGVLPSQEERDGIEAGTNTLRVEGFVPHPAAGDGVFGTLTARGLEQMRLGGANLRDMYPDFLPKAASREEVIVYSTDFPRTIQSVQALLQGLFPPAERSAPIEIDATRTDLMIPDPVPRRTTEQVEREAAVLGGEAVLAHAAEVEPLRRRYSEVLRDAQTLDPVAYEMSGAGAGDDADGGHLLSWNKLAELMKCMHAYGRLPDGLSEDDVKQASAAGAHRWTALMRDPRIAQLAMGHMAADVVSAACDARGATAAKDSSMAPKLVVWSGHDSTLFGLLALFALDAPVAWPPYAAQLHVEVLEEVDGWPGRARGWYLRFSLNGEVLKCGLGCSKGAEPVDVVSLDDVEVAVFGAPRATLTKMLDQMIY